jgi:hypothetical protein
MTSSVLGRVEKAVRSELRGLSVSVQDSGTAALAVSLASQIDRARGAVAAAAAAAQLRMLLEDLRRKAEAARPTRDGIDDLATRRASRRGSA